jgi:hypothetical protein
MVKASQYALLVAALFATSGRAEHLRAGYGSLSASDSSMSVTGSLESVVKPLTVGTTSVVQPLTSVTETSSYTMFNNDNYYPPQSYHGQQRREEARKQARYKQRQEETAKRHHKITVERNKAAKYLKMLEKFQSEDAKMNFIQKQFKKNTADPVGAMLGLANFVYNVKSATKGDGSGFAIDHAVSSVLSQEQLRHLSGKHLVVEFRVPYSLSKGEVYPVRGPLIGSPGHLFRQWKEVTRGDPGIHPGTVQSVVFQIPDQLLHANKMAGRTRPLVRKDCGTDYCVHKKADLNEEE